MDWVYPMDILALILTCSVYPDDHLIRAMVDLASQENPHFVGDLVTLVTFDRTNSVTDAQRVVSLLERRGGKPVVGLLGVPVSWATRYRKSAVDLFDSCTNLMVGSSVLQNHYEACSNNHTSQLSSSSQRKTRVAPPEAIRQCALRRYGADLGIDGYAESALKYFARQRVLFADGSNATASATDPACRCSELPAPPPRRSTSSSPGNSMPRAARPSRPSTANLTDRLPSLSKGPGGAPILE
jgi:hypothetical protein